MCPNSDQRSAGRSLAIALALAVTFAGRQGALAQDDLTLPPRLTGEEQPPGDPADRAAETPAEIEEIVVVSDQNPWRLPDLGSSWRPPQGAEDDGRIAADLLPIWDPDTEEIPTENPFDVTDDFSRVGFIEVFRIRFGRR